MKIDRPLVRLASPYSSLAFYEYYDLSSLLHFQELIARESEIELVNLTANAVYGVTVVARSKYGTSLPSTLLIINTTNAAGSECRCLSVLSLLFHACTSSGAS